MMPDEIRPENTAITRRNGIPRPVRRFREVYLKREQTVLDFGCGRGEAARYLQREGFDVTNYDSAPKFGADVLPDRQFDVVMAIYVLNVLGPEKRVTALHDAWSFVKPGGQLFVVTRTREQIEAEAKEKGWERHLDGYFSDRKTGRFQRGLNFEDLEQLVQGLENAGEMRNAFREEKEFSSLIAEKAFRP